MKTFIHLKTKKNILSLGLICFLTTSFNALNAQSEIWEVTNFPADSNLIRPIDRDRILIYNYTKTYPSIGTLVHPLHNTYYRYIYTNPAYHFSDFEIVNNKYAYFCGQEISGASSYGMFAYVNVGSFDINTVSLDFVFFMFSNSNNGYSFLNFSKIEAFDVQDGTHLILIGEALDRDSNIVSCMVDAYGPSIENSPSTSWTYRALYGVDYKEKFNDITVTDNYVVSISKQSLSGDLFLRLYDKPTTITDDIFSTTTYETVKYLCFLEPHSNVVLRNNERDYYTMAYYAYNGNKWGLSVHSYNASNVYAEGFMEIDNQQNSDIVIRDIWYNKYNNTTDILCDSMGEYPTFLNPPSYKYCSFMHIYPSGSAFTAELHALGQGYNFYSNCIIPANSITPHMSIAVGKYNGIMEFYWGDLENVGNCTDKYRFTAKELYLSGKEYEVPQTIGIGGAGPDRYTLYPTNTLIENICE